MPGERRFGRCKITKIIKYRKIFHSDSQKKHKFANHNQSGAVADTKLNAGRHINLYT